MENLVLQIDSRCKQDAQFCMQLMEKLNLIPFIVVGWSEGGRTAIHTAGLAKTIKNHAQPVVTHAVLLCTSTQVTLRAESVFKGMRDTNQWSESARAVYLQHYSEEYFRSQWAALCDVVSKVYKELGGRFPSDNVLSTLKIPTLIINGGKDRFSLDPKLMAAKLQNPKIEIHAQAGHDVHIKYPRWFSDQIMNFIRSNS